MADDLAPEGQADEDERLQEEHEYIRLTLIGKAYIALPVLAELQKSLALADREADAAVVAHAYEAVYAITQEGAENG